MRENLHVCACTRRLLGPAKGHMPWNEPSLAFSLFVYPRLPGRLFFVRRAPQKFAELSRAWSVTPPAASLYIHFYCFL